MTTVLPKGLVTLFVLAVIAAGAAWVRHASRDQEAPPGVVHYPRQLLALLFGAGAALLLGGLGWKLAAPPFGTSALYFVPECLLGLGACCTVAGAWVASYRVTYADGEATFSSLGQRRTVEAGSLRVREEGDVWKVVGFEGKVLFQVSSLVLGGQAFVVWAQAQRVAELKRKKTIKAEGRAPGTQRVRRRRSALRA
ncbi:MAG: hypothetical protein R3F62_29015 [Planctomycetota bacterium]